MTYTCRHQVKNLSENISSRTAVMTDSSSVKVINVIV